MHWIKDTGKIFLNEDKSCRFIKEKLFKIGEVWPSFPPSLVMCVIN